MEKKCACYDVDGTLAKGILVIPLMKSEYDNGILDKSTYEKLNEILEKYKNKEIDYETASQELLDVHAAGLEGKTELDLETHASEFVNNNTNLFRSFGKQVIDLLRDDYKQVIVTSEPQYLAKVILKYFKVDEALSTQYEIIDGKFTGIITNSLADRNAKLASLSDYEIEYAFGDSESDIEMLRKSNYSYCVSPTDGLREVGLSSGWHIYDDEECLGIVEDVRQLINS